MTSQRQWTVEIDASAVVLLLGVFLLIILCAGDPDLLDALIAWIGRQP